MPNSSTVPVSGVSNPSTMRSNVDFPEPLGPASAANSPVRTAMLTSDSTDSLP